MNKVVLLGRIVKDPDLTFAAGKGTAICKFTIAVNRAFKKGEADFINCVCFNKTAETIAQYFVKGSQICISGSIQTGSYENKSGNKVYTTDILVDNFDFVDKNTNTNKNVNNNTNNTLNDMQEVEDTDIPF